VRLTDASHEPLTGPDAPGQPGTPWPGTSRSSIPRLVGAVWALLVINTLGSQGAVTVVTIPQPVFQVVTMGALPAAFGLALVLNPRLRIRPSAYLFLLSLLLVVSVASSARMESGYGALFRSGRFTLFVATLWLLSPWFADSMRFVRHHIRALGAVLATVVVGLVVAPGLAMPAFYDGRVVGAIWPLTPPQVGLYAAVVIGLTMLLWLGRRTDRWSAILLAGPATVLLLLSHTRTAAIGLVAGLAVAILSLTLTSARARRVFTRVAIVAALVWVLFLPAIQAWLERGQDEESLANLTGRLKVWDALLYAPRTTSEYLVGVGLSNKSFNGLSIDNSWLAVYYEQGVIGVAIVAMFVACLVIVAALRPPSLERACAIFLIVYCLIASYAEVGLGDASPYLLNLTVAAALLTRGGSRAVAAVSPARVKVT
jgi:O-antigen ligase